jgi:drug/metabolite transporter (DMT)-like permease
MIYIILSLVSYSAAILLGVYANRYADFRLVAAIVNGISLLLPLILIFSKWKQSTGTQNTQWGLIAAVCGGVVISAFTLFLGKAYELNNVAVVGPAVFGGAIVITSVLSMFLFKEKIVPLQAMGLFFVTLGLGLVVYARLKA